jgi:NADPH:quinone reductase-like Zn-dependent oxidoreductase
MARIVEFASYGAPEVLEFRDVSDPQPAAGEVRIRVKAIVAHVSMFLDA